MTAAAILAQPLLPTYLDGFPLPDRAPYSIAVDMGLIRSAMAAGNVRQRRQYANMPQLFSLTFHLHTAELWVWQTWVNETAYNWFYLPLASMYAAAGPGFPGGMISYHIARFTSDLAVTLEGHDWYSVTVAAEISPQMYATAPRPAGLDRIDALGPADALVDVIDGGVPFRLSMDGPIDGGGPLVIQQTQLAALIGATVTLEATLSAISPVAMAADLTGTASLDAALAVIGQVLLAANLSGTGALAATVSIAGSRQLAAQLTGTGSLGAGLTVTPPPTYLAANLTGTGTMTAALTIALPPVTLAASLAGTGSLAATPTLIAPLDSDAAAYIAAMTVLPDPDRRTLINNLVTGLKADGLWTQIDWLVLLAAHDSQAARINVRKPTKIATAVGGVTFTVDRGYQGDGTTGYLDFGETAMATGNVFARTSAFVMTYANLGSGASQRQIGTATGTTSTINISAADTGNEFYALNASAAQGLSGAGVIGSRIAVRTTSGNMQLYKNGASVSSGSASAVAPDAGNTLLLRGSNTAFGNHRLACAGTGGGLSSANILQLHNRLLTYLTALGAN
jgi:hypothetical protein